MNHVIKIVGCLVLALLCVAIPILTALSFVYKWSGSVSFLLLVVSVAITSSIFVALMDAE